MNQKWFRRLYREEGLTVRKRGGRNRALGMRAPMALPSRPIERWSLDFVSGTFTGGWRFPRFAHRRRLHARLSGAVADTSLSGARVACEPDTMMAIRCRPKTCVSDNGTELGQNINPELSP